MDIGLPSFADTTALGKSAFAPSNTSSLDASNQPFSPASPINFFDQIVRIEIALVRLSIVEIQRQVVVRDGVSHFTGRSRWRLKDEATLYECMEAVLSEKGLIRAINAIAEASEGKELYRMLEGLSGLEILKFDNYLRKLVNAK